MQQCTFLAPSTLPTLRAYVCGCTGGVSGGGAEAAAGLSELRRDSISSRLRASNNNSSQRPPTDVAGQFMQQPADLGCAAGGALNARGERCEWG